MYLPLPLGGRRHAVAAVRAVDSSAVASWFSSHAGGAEEACLSSSFHEIKNRDPGHETDPDPPGSSFQISYRLPPIKVEVEHLSPDSFSNFRKAKTFYESMILDRQREQKDVYVDDEAFGIFRRLFPEIVESRMTGRLKVEHFSSWEYREKNTKAEELLLQKIFHIIDEDSSNSIDIAELACALTEAGIENVDLNLLEAQFQDIDTDKNGVIDFDEFKTWWFSNSHSNWKLEALHKSLISKWDEIGRSLVENNVEVRMDPGEDQLPANQSVDALCVGGPSTYAAALLHKAMYPEQSVLHMVGNRFDSNADGSAYYYHERDAFPVYINKVNTAWYCLYADSMKRMKSAQALVRQCRDDRHMVKISINWSNLFSNWYYIPSIFIPNSYHAFMDLLVRKPAVSLMAQACLHSQMVPKVVERMCEKLKLPFRAFLIRDENRAVYIDVDGEKKAGEHFEWLNEYADIPFHNIPTDQFGSLVTEVLSFPRDGALNPWMFENFYTAFQQLGIHHGKGWFLDCIYVQPNEKEPHRVTCTKAQLRHQATGKTKVIAVKKLLLSLGPTGQLVVDEKSSILAPGDSTTVGGGGSGLAVRKALNSVKSTLFRGDMVHKTTMWAAGSSSVALVGVKRGSVAQQKLGVFRKFIDGVNQHWTLVKEREVLVGENTYDFFVLQMTGGGNFPSRYTDPTYVANLLYTTEAVFGLDEMTRATNSGDVVYDIVQSRGCGRSVSSRNTIGFSPIASNAVSAYGLGGIGMTTAFANAALKLQMLEALAQPNGDKDLKARSSQGIIGSDEAQGVLAQFYGENPFAGVKYDAIIDDPQLVARRLGVDVSVAPKEKIGLAVFAGSSALALPLVTSLIF